MEYNEPKINMDISESSNEVIKNTLSKPSRSIGDACGIVLDFFNNTILLPLQKYNIKAKFELENYTKELENKLLEIPKEKLIKPKINIIGPAFESLKYNMDEKDIKDMFTNLITKSVNSDYIGKITPAYVDIIKQLSSEDAKYIKKIYEISKNTIAILELKIDYPEGFKPLRTHAIIDKNDDYFFIDQCVLDNLLRLQLIQIPYEIILLNTNYNDIFNKIKQSKQMKLLQLPESTKLNYFKKSIDFTSLGRNFIDICLS